MPGGATIVPQIIFQTGKPAIETGMSDAGFVADWSTRQRVDYGFTVLKIRSSYRVPCTVTYSILRAKYHKASIYRYLASSIHSRTKNLLIGCAAFNQMW